MRQLTGACLDALMEQKLIMKSAIDAIVEQVVNTRLFQTLQSHTFPERCVQ